MFFEDIFEVFEDEMWLPILTSATEEEIKERDLNEMTEEEIRSFYE